MTYSLLTLLTDWTVHEASGATAVMPSFFQLHLDTWLGAQLLSCPAAQLRWRGVVNGVAPGGDTGAGLRYLRGQGQVLCPRHAVNAEASVVRSKGKSKSRPESVSTDEVSTFF